MINAYSVGRVAIKISDPWELGVQLNWQSLYATIITESDSAILLQIDSPFTFNGITCEYFVATPRHVGFKMSELQNQRNIFCGITRVSEEQAKSSEPMDLSRWRGGLAFVGELEPIN